MRLVEVGEYAYCVHGAPLVIEGTVESVEEMVPGLEVVRLSGHKNPLQRRNCTSDIREAARQCEANSCFWNREAEALWKKADEIDEEGA